MIEAVPAEAEGLPEKAEPAEEIPDWLADLQAEEPIAPEVAEPPAELEITEVVEAAEPTKEIPDWLAALQAGEPTAPEVAEVAEAAEPAEGIPDWLAALQAEEPTAPQVAEPPAEPDITEIAVEAVELTAAEAQPEETKAAEEVPDWLASLQAEEPTVPPAAVPGIIEAPAERPEPVEEEELVEEVTAAGIPVEAEVVELETLVDETEEIESALAEEAVPDWLAGWQEEKELGESAKVEVEAEIEKVSAAEMAVPQVTEEAKEEPVSFIVSSYLSRLDTHPGDHEVRLALARAYRDEKKLSGAFEQFQKLVDSGRLVKELLPDLEGVCASRPDDARWYQLLGDAYLRTNQLAEALDAYRAAQDALSRR